MFDMRLVSFQEDLQGVVGEPEQLERWRQGGHSARNVKRLQQRAQNILDDWLDYYRRATGISPSCTPTSGFSVFYGLCTT